MKNVIIATVILLTGTYALNVIAANIIKDFEVNNEELLPEFRFGGQKEHGKLSQFIEDKTWNRCLKLEQLNYRLDPITKKRSMNIYAIVGGGTKRPGFTCKPNTNYNFSFEAKGNRMMVIVIAKEWDKNGKKSYQHTSIIRFKPQQEWTTYKGTFRTKSSTVRAALAFQFWGNEKHKDAMGKPSDYVLFDKIIIEESEPGIFEKKSVPLPLSPTRLSRVYIAPTTKPAPVITDFQQIKTSDPAKDQTELSIIADEDAFLITIKCHDLEMESLKASMNKASTSSALWRDDVVEIFFDSIKPDRRLNQFVISAGGGRWMGNGAKPLSQFDSWSADVTKNPQDWTAKVRIPYKTLGFDAPPQKGDLIKFNVCRQRPKSQELSALAFPGENFHDKSKWAVMFIDSIAPYAEKMLTQANSVKNNPTVNRLIKKIDVNDPVNAYMILEKLKTAIRYAKLSKQRFILAQLSPTGVDPAIPFLPKELNHETKVLKVQAAVNEFATMALALANMTNSFEEYRLQISSGLSFENDAAWFKSETEGLKDGNGKIFPMSKIELRRGIQSKDSDAPLHGKRYDLLSKLNQASTIPIASRQGGLIWITFDCRGITPGIYKGYLNVIPLNEVCESFKLSKNKEHFEAKGNFGRYPIELEILPITLAEESPMPVWFYRHANNAVTFDFMRKYDMAFYQLTPWWFAFEFNDDGSIEKPQLAKTLLPLLRMQHQAMRQSRMKSNPKFAIAFSAYPVFKKVHIGRNSKNITFNSPEYWNAWRHWIKAVEKIMADNGIQHEEYIIEVFDEPQFKTPELEDEAIRAYAEAKKAAPNVQLAVVNGHPSEEGFKKLAKLVDYYYFGQHHIVKAPQENWAASLNQTLGKRTGVYACGTSMRQDPYRYYRRMPWLALRHNTDSVGLFSFINHGAGYGASDFYKAPFGGLAYMAGNENPIPSIRLEAFRVGMMDIKYMKRLKELANQSNNKELVAQAKALLKQGPYDVETKYPHDKTKADTIRAKAIELILKLKNEK